MHIMDNRHFPLICEHCGAMWDDNHAQNGCPVAGATERILAGYVPRRPIGDCPIHTPGCKYADCSSEPGKSCYGPNAPQHVDMLSGPGDRFDA
jgi:hypothetical protein